MWYVYLLKSEVDNSYYTGTTKDLKQRVKEHNWRQTKSTSSKAPYKLEWYCAFSEKTLAYKFERYLKSSSGYAFRNKHFIP